MSASVSKGRLIPAAILAILVYGMIAAMLGTLLPQLSARLSLSPEQNSVLALVQALGLSVASISAGPLIDNRGKKTGMVLGLAIITISLFVLPNVPGVGLLTACWFALGFGGGIIVTAANALVSDISADRRASVLNLLNLFFGLGLMSTPFIAANVVSGDAIKLCYLTAILTAVALLLNATAPIPGPTGERGFRLSEVNEILGRPALYMLALLLFLYVACEVGFSTWLARHLIAQGMPEKTALNILFGFRAGNPDWPRRGLTDSHQGSVQNRHPGLSHADEHHHLCRDPNVGRHGSRSGCILRRPRNGAGLPHHPRHGGRRISQSHRHRHGHRDHQRLDWPGHQRAHHRRDRRNRSQAPANRLAAVSSGLRAHDYRECRDAPHAGQARDRVGY